MFLLLPAVPFHLERVALKDAETSEDRRTIYRMLGAAGILVDFGMIAW